MASTFGAPVMGAQAGSDTGQGQGPGQTGGDQSQLNQAQEIIDPNDPALTSEAIDVNTEGDAYAFPPPPPDGKYRAKLKLVQQEQDGPGGKQKVDYIAKKHDKQGLYLASSIEANIIDPSGKYDGIPVYDSWVGTFMGRDGSTKVSTILSRLKQPDGSAWVKPGTKMSHTDWMKLFVRALAGEPEIGIETQWEWSCQGCGEEAKAKGAKYPKSVVGMNKFPVDTAKSKPGATVYQPEMRCAVNPAHMFSRARVRIARFVSLSEVK